MKEETVRCILRLIAVVTLLVGGSDPYHGRRLRQQHIRTANYHDQDVIQRQLGHTNLATTSRYLDHVAPEDVIAAVRKMGSE